MSKRNRIGPPGANWWDKKKPVKDKPKPPWQLSPGRRPLHARTETCTLPKLPVCIEESTIHLQSTYGIDVGDVGMIDGITFSIVSKTGTSITVKPKGYIGRPAAAML